MDVTQTAEDAQWPCLIQNVYTTAQIYYYSEYEI